MAKYLKNDSLSYTTSEKALSYSVYLEAPPLCMSLLFEPVLQQRTL